MVDFSKLSPSLSKDRPTKSVKYRVPDENRIREALLNVKKGKRKTKPELECLFCTNKFQPKRYWSKFCSKQCRNDYHNERRYEAVDVET
jgi:hypothetical protein